MGWDAKVSKVNIKDQESILSFDAPDQQSISTATT